jgi:hypothetical protein
MHTYINTCIPLIGGKSRLQPNTYIYITEYVQTYIHAYIHAYIRESHLQSIHIYIIEIIHAYIPIISVNPACSQIHTYN